MSRGAILPDIGGMLGGLPHPREKEIRRKEPPASEFGRKTAAKETAPAAEEDKA